MDNARLARAIDRILALPEADRQAAIAAEAAGDAEFAAALEKAVSENEAEDKTKDAPFTPGSGSGGSPWASGLNLPRSLVPDEEIIDGSLRYRLVRRFPGGGLGEVWAAEQLTPVRRMVAMKFIRDDRTTKGTLDRFENERRLLASFDHPNIARYYDAGHHGDRPWFAMELVQGETIDVYCRRNSLTVEERIRLVQNVARAVQYAHDREVIHRDLKPHNILVSTDGMPKLLDFGIAKILKQNFDGPRGITSDFEPQTEEYASPEQLDNASSTTRSDVYALGVLLYELLTDQLPYHVRTRVREAIRELKKREPPPPMSEALDEVQDEPAAAAGSPAEAAPPTPAPSGAAGSSGTRGRGSRQGRGRQPSRRLTEIARSRGTRPDRLVRLLQGNLDNIVLKAMRIEPLRRYESPAALAADLENHLQRLPVAALPESTAARLSRVLVRNRWLVAGSLMTLVVAVGVLMSMAALESKRARSETQRSILRSGFGSAVQLLDESASQATRDAGSFLRLRETLTQMQADYAALAEAGGDDLLAVNDWIEAGEIRRRLSVLADSPANRSVNAGNAEESAAWAERAQEALDSAVSTAERIGDGLPLKALELSARLARDRGDAALHRKDQLALAEPNYLEAASMFDRAIAAAQPGTADEARLRRDRLTVATKLADVAQRLGRHGGLVLARSQVVDGYRDQLQRSESADARLDLSIGLLRLGEAMEIRDQSASKASHQCFEESLEVLLPALDARAAVSVRRGAMEAMLYLADRLLTRAETPEPPEQAQEDRRRAGELLVEAANHGVMLAALAPVEMRVREDLLRLHQTLLPGIDREWALRALETIRIVRIEPDRSLLREARNLPVSAVGAMDGPVSRALRIASGNRLMEQWQVSVKDGQLAGLPDHASVGEIMRDSWRLARAASSEGQTHLPLLVESMWCLALAADGEVAKLIWNDEAERAAARAESLDMARSLRDRISVRKGELFGAITIAHWHATGRLSALEPGQAEPPPGQ
jgi:serine/threonine protein kinase